MRSEYFLHRCPAAHPSCWPSAVPERDSPDSARRLLNEYSRAIFPEWRPTVKQRFGKSADPWVSSLWQRCPGARQPQRSDSNKEQGWRLQLEHAKKQCMSPDLSDLPAPPPPPPPFSPSILPALFFSPCVSWLLSQHEWGALPPPPRANNEQRVWTVVVLFKPFHWRATAEALTARSCHDSGCRDTRY